MELKRLLTKEVAIRQRIDKLIGKKTPSVKRTQSFYETRISVLKNLWTQFCEIDLDITQTLYRMTMIKNNIRM